MTPFLHYIGDIYSYLSAFYHMQFYLRTFLIHNPIYYIFVSFQEKLPTVDLTDDSVSDGQSHSSHKNNQRALPFRCDLCPAQYPNSIGLNKHRQSFHKTGGPCEFGVPLIDLKQPGILQRLSNIGIHNYIPISGATTNSTLAMPVINVNALSKNNNLGNMGVSNVLTLGPIRALPRQGNNNAGHK